MNKPYEPLVEEYKHANQGSSSDSDSSSSFQIMHLGSFKRICCAFLILHLVCLAISILALVYALGAPSVQKEEALILTKTAPLKSKIDNLTAELDGSLITIHKLETVVPASISKEVKALLAQQEASSNETFRILKESLSQQQSNYNTTLDELRQQFQSQLRVMNGTMQHLMLQMAVQRTSSNYSITDIKEQLNVAVLALRTLEHQLEIHQNRANTSFQRQHDTISTLEGNVQLKLDAVRNDIILLHPNSSDVIVHNSSSPCRSRDTINMTQSWRKDHSGARIKPIDGGYNCDARLFDNIQWFRITGDAGNQISNTCPPPYSCGSHGGMWTNATMPTAIGVPVQVKIYGAWDNSCSWYPWTVDLPLTVMRCSFTPGAYVYKVDGVSGCHWSICSRD